MKKYILTDKELKLLLHDSVQFNYLQCVGVDNWNGYDEAHEALESDGYENYAEVVKELLTQYEEYKVNE